jgi:hypothetical protein
MKTILSRAGLALMVMAGVVYLLDWGVWGVRQVRGSGMRTVQVTWFQVAELKGGKQDMYPDGSGPVNCSVSLAPHGGGNPCWYVEQHPVVLEH